MKKLVLTGAAGRLGSYLREPLSALCGELVSSDLAPDIGTQPPDAETLAGDMDALCDLWGLPAAAEADPAPAQIVVQLMDREVPRGQPAPEAAQFFAGYRYDGATCIWEAF